ncbi:hypothetical protein E2562_021371 [Oryza meyeriana var. granulata]|uniref:Uncharacterized protein n=1 Tax=Oryza meyeriana var. granulata TaxID=110450 RepID=A0A6G1CJ77_9ORYZ|nr:hypothetical protein E2562_021371 [Oryza meyeriana var. granulata]
MLGVGSFATATTTSFVALTGGLEPEQGWRLLILEAMFMAVAVAEYIFACFVSHDPNFRQEPVKEGIQAVSEEAANTMRVIMHD